MYPPVACNIPHLRSVEGALRQQRLRRLCRSNSDALTINMLISASPYAHRLSAPSLALPSNERAFVEKAFDVPRDPCPCRATTDQPSPDHPGKTRRRTASRSWLDPFLERYLLFFPRLSFGGVQPMRLPLGRTTFGDGERAEAHMMAVQAKGSVHAAPARAWVLPQRKNSRRAGRSLEFTASLGCFVRHKEQFDPQDSLAG